MNKNPISVMLNDDLAKWLDKYCKDTGKTKAGLVRSLLTKKMKEVSKKEESCASCGCSFELVGYRMITPSVDGPLGVDRDEGTIMCETCLGKLGWARE